MVLNYFLRGGVTRPRDSTCPRSGRVFLVFNAFGVGFLASLKKKQKNKTKQNKKQNKTKQKQKQ
jgi:hypothetical protein